jgi:hypothetical protein
MIVLELWENDSPATSDLKLRIYRKRPSDHLHSFTSKSVIADFYNPQLLEM